VKRSVLVVDDEPLIVDMLKKALTTETVEVAGAYSGEEALVYVSDHHVDLVITDIMLPGILGTELFFQIKKIEPFTQIIIITGVPTLESIKQMLEGGANDFIIKPFGIEELKEIVSDSFARLDRWRECTLKWVEFRPTVSQPPKSSL
jgi:DNA-binding response OmpR family regulator